MIHYSHKSPRRSCNKKRHTAEIFFEAPRKYAGRCDNKVNVIGSSWHDRSALPTLPASGC